MKNILSRKAGQADRVYVQCQDCNEFVASYKIAPLGYYHHGKGFESFLRGVHRSGEFMSGRRVKQLFEKRKSGAIESFQKVLKLLEAREEEE
ncbi:MAG: hypothetical protein KJO29_01440 [Bacteroidia bacterium]|nr:hypothetical protein [Bacteroidia bacterium]